MKKLFLILVMVCSVICLASCEVGDFFNHQYYGNYYKKNDDGSFASEKVELWTTTGEVDSELRAYHTMTFTTNPEIDIKSKEILYIMGSFNVDCEVETKYHIQLKWTQGFWYKDEIFVDEYYTVNPGDSLLEYEVDMYDTESEEKGFKIPSNNDATITISISATVNDEEIKDYKIAFKHIEFMIEEHNEEVLEDESLKQNADASTEETESE